MTLEHLSTLLSKKVTRKEFLLHVGFVLLALTGVSGMLKILADPRSASSTTSTQPKRGFGSGPYGI